MPVDLEMLLSTSPSLFTHSTISDCRFSNFAVQNRNFLNCHRTETNHSPFGYHSVTSCFEEHISSRKKESYNDWNKQKDPNEVSHVHSKTEKKKRVSFADDKGLSLVDIRLISESPESNPTWADDFLSMLTCGVKPNVTLEKKWKPTFDHPPFDSKVLSRRTEKDMVALENAVLQDDNEDLLTGLIKVKNIAFEKNVFVRATFDRWVSYVDIPATFANENDEQISPMEASGGLDTFKFSVEIPPSATRYQVVEFCVGYQCSGKEYWDNNSGINYRLVCSSSAHRQCPTTQNSTNGRKYSTVESPAWVRLGYW